MKVVLGGGYDQGFPKARFVNKNAQNHYHTMREAIPKLDVVQEHQIPQYYDMKN